MRLIFIALALAGMAAAGLGQDEPRRRSVEEIIKLPREEYIPAFREAVRFGSSLSFDDFARLLENFPQPANQRADRYRGDSDYELGQSFETACERGGSAGIDRLARIFAILPVGNYTRREMLFALAKLWLERELDAITAQPAEALELDPEQRPIPERLQAMPEDLQAAVQLTEAVCAPYQAWREAGKDDPYIAFQKNEDAFWKTAGAFLSGETTEAPKVLQQFRWGGWCGTGSEALQQPKSLLTLMILLQQRRLPEALGAALEIPETGELGKPLWPERDCRRRLLEYFGLDWEAVFVGGLLVNPFRFSFADPFSGRVATSGSPRGVHLLVTSLRYIEPQDIKPIPALIAALGRAPEKPRQPVPNDKDEAAEPLFTISTHPPPPLRSTLLPSDVQDEVIQAISAWAGPDRESFQLTGVTQALDRLVCPATTEALTRLATHSDRQIAEAAIQALRDRGAPEPDYHPTPPLRFVLQMAGRPVAEAKIDYGVEYASGGSMSSASTDAQGHFELPGKALGRTDQKAVRISFTAERYPSGPRTLTHPAFQTALPLPLPLPVGDVIPIQIRAQPLVLLISYPRALPAFAGKEIKLTLTPLDRPEGLFGYSTPATYAAPAGPRLEFPAVQEGRYQLQVEVSGTARWDLAELTISDRPRTLEVKLAPGSDVTGHLPTGSDDLFGVDCELWQDGRKLDRYSGFINHDRFSVSGVPVGRYVLRIPSSSERKGPNGADPREIVLPDQPKWASVDVPFEVTPSSPAILDLGKIELAARK